MFRLPRCDVYLFTMEGLVSYLSLSYDHSYLLSLIVIDLYLTITVYTVWKERYLVRIRQREASTTALGRDLSAMEEPATDSDYTM